MPTITDLGQTGPDKGAGGKYLILPPRRHTITPRRCRRHRRESRRCASWHRPGGGDQVPSARCPAQRGLKHEAPDRGAGRWWSRDAVAGTGTHLGFGIGGWRGTRQTVYGPKGLLTLAVAFAVRWFPEAA